jgi:hypothetical protein
VHDDVARQDFDGRGYFAQRVLSRRCEAVSSALIIYNRHASGRARLGLDRDCGPKKQDQRDADVGEEDVAAGFKIEALGFLAGSGPRHELVDPADQVAFGDPAVTAAVRVRGGLITIRRVLEAIP